ncbi:MAG: hypothetical protein HYX25_08695 [Candidatus Solibacter usitatus]|nr:hypothetical protein [Candidatus Solibacter usitatus]
MSARRLWLWLVIAAGTAAAQTHSIQGPRLGWVFDEAAGALRPIVGIAGSSTMGDPLPLAVGLKRAVVSPTQDYALAVAGNDARVHLIRPRQNSNVLLKPLPDANRAPDRMVISPTGSAAAFYYYNGRGAGHIVVMNGFPQQPRISAQMSVLRVPAPTALAVADDGAVVLAGAGNLVIAATENAEIPVTSALGKVASLAFITGHDALIADGAKDEIYLLRLPHRLRSRHPATAAPRSSPMRKPARW